MQKAFYYLICPLFSFGLPVLIVFDLPLRAPRVYQTWLAISTWSWPLALFAEFKYCGFRCVFLPLWLDPPLFAEFKGNWGWDSRIAIDETCRNNDFTNLSYSYIARELGLPCDRGRVADPGAPPSSAQFRPSPCSPCPALEPPMCSAVVSISYCSVLSQRPSRRPGQSHAAALVVPGLTSSSFTTAGRRTQSTWPSSPPSSPSCTS